MKNAWIGLVIILTAAAGCVPQAEMVKLRNDLNDVRAQVNEVKTRVPDVSGIQKKQDQIEENLKGSSDLQQRIADQWAKYDQLMTDLQLLQGKLEENNSARGPPPSTEAGRPRRGSRRPAAAPRGPPASPR